TLSHSWHSRSSRHPARLGQGTRATRRFRGVPPRRDGLSALRASSSARIGPQLRPGLPRDREVSGDGPQQATTATEWSGGLLGPLRPWLAKPLALL
ncbi:hypothetical protein LCGC14_1650630, partial [marine sediment metagenome]